MHGPPRMIRVLQCPGVKAKFRPQSAAATKQAGLKLHHTAMLRVVSTQTCDCCQLLTRYSYSFTFSYSYRCRYRCREGTDTDTDTDTGMHPTACNPAPAAGQP